MNGDEAKTIAAWGGLTLGLVNLVHSWYRDYILKPKLIVTGGNGKRKEFYEGNWIVQAELILAAKFGDVYLRSIQISHKNKSLLFPKVVHFVYSDSEHDFLSLGNSIDEIQAALQATAVRVRDLEVANGQQRSIGVLIPVKTERLSDGWDDAPRDGWHVELVFNDERVTTIPLQDLDQSRL